MTTNNIETQKSTEVNETNLTPEQEKQVKEETKKIIQENAQISLEDFKKSLTAKKWVILSDSQAEWYLNEAKKESAKTEVEAPKTEAEQKEKAQEVIEAAKTGDVEKVVATTAAAVGGAKTAEAVKDGKFSWKNIKETISEWIDKIKDFFSKLLDWDFEGAMDVFSSPVEKWIKKISESTAYHKWLHSVIPDAINPVSMKSEYVKLMKEEKFAKLTIADFRKQLENPEKAAENLGLKSSVNSVRWVLIDFFGTSNYEKSIWKRISEFFEWNLIPEFWKNKALSSEGAYNIVKSDFEKTHWTIDEEKITMKEYFEKLATVDIS